MKPNVILKTSSLVTVLLVTALVLAAHVAGQEPSAHPPLIQLRLARETPAPGFALTKSLADSTLYVASRVILEDAGIQQARTSPTTDGVVLTIHVTPQAATRLTESFKGHIGWRLAILVNGQLNGAGVIKQELRISAENPATLAIHLPRAAADEFAAAVAARWPAHR